MEVFEKFGKIITPIGVLVTLMVLIFTPFFQISKQNGVIKTEITHLKEGQKRIETKFDKKFEIMDKKFEDMNKKFEDMNKTLFNFLLSQQNKKK